MKEALGSRRKRGSLPSPAKAAEMLRNPPHGGKGASPAQHRFFEGIAHGWAPTGMKSKRRKRGKH